MGRGLGKVQREILDTLGQHGPFHLTALSDGDMGSRYKALHRAACKLDEAGLIDMHAYHFGKHKVVIAPAGTGMHEHTIVRGRVSMAPNYERKDVERVSREIEAQREALKNSKPPLPFSRKP